MSASLNPLGNDDVHPSLFCAECGIHRANLMQHSDTSGMGCGYEFKRISPEERQRCNLFVNAHLNALSMREVEDKVHSKWPGGKRAKMTYVTSQRVR